LSQYAAFRVGFLFLAAAFAATYLFAVSNARGEARACANEPMVVVSPGDVDTRNICGAAKDAISFLRHIGLVVRTNIEIEIVKKLPLQAKMDALGCYDRRVKKIYVLEFELCGAKFKNSILYGTGPPELSYRSLIAHEVAHFIVFQNLAKQSASWVVQEYVASVTQLATLPPLHRERILSRIGGSGFEDSNKINATVLLASPDFFAANAYRHFIKPENGAAFVRRLLAGSIRLNDRLFPPDSR